MVFSKITFNRKKIVIHDINKQQYLLAADQIVIITSATFMLEYFNGSGRFCLQNRTKLK